MKKIIECSDVPVDAGLILISDEKFYEKYEGSFEEDNWLMQRFDVEPGVFKCKWNIPNTWNGDVEGEGLLEITSGKMIVSDPCYLIDDMWDKVLDDTDYFHNEPDGTVVLNKMGGDGCYNVTIELEKV